MLASPAIRFAAIGLAAAAVATIGSRPAATQNVVNRTGQRLCASHETVLFQCAVGPQTVAVCGGHDGRGNAYAQYRHGTVRRQDLVFPARPGASGLGYAARGYSGGGAAQIRFSRAGYSYAVYSQVIRTGFGRDGLHNPAFDSGYFIMRGGRLVARRHCNVRDDGAVDLAHAPAFMPQVEFLDPPGG